MFITQMELNKLRVAQGGAMSEGEILTSLIRDDKETDSYKMAAVADRYYLGKHDVKDHCFTSESIAETVTTESGAQVEQFTTYTNPNRSDVRTANPFFWVHVLQKIQYVLGREPSISVKDTAPGAKEYGDALHDTTDAAFMKLLGEWATASAKGGKAWIKEYYDQDGRLRQAVIPRCNGIPIYDTTHDKTLVEFIYHYCVDVHLGRSKTIKRTYAEWWTAKGVTYYYADENEAFKVDPERAGVRPHYKTATKVNGADGVTQQVKKIEPKMWERFPFVELLNNEEGLSDLARYKDLIDAYDLIQSKGSNNALDFNEFFAILQGYGGETANAIVRKLRINQAVNINGQGGNIDLKQLDLAMAGRIDWLMVLRDAIHEFGMAVDIKKADFGAAPSGVALRFQYTLLDLKANALITQMKAALEQHFWFITQTLNSASAVAFDPASIDISFSKSAIMNDLETIGMINLSVDTVPERILLAHHPFVDDPDAALKEMEKQRKKKAKEAQKAFGAYGLPDEPDPDDKDDDK